MHSANTSERAPVTHAPAPLAARVLEKCDVEVSDAKPFSPVLSQSSALRIGSIPSYPVVRRDAPSRSRDRLDLWAKFHRHGYETKDLASRSRERSRHIARESVPHRGVDLLPWEPRGRRCLRGCPARGPLGNLLLLRPKRGGPIRRCTSATQSQVPASRSSRRRPRTSIRGQRRRSTRRTPSGARC